MSSKEFRVGTTIPEIQRKSCTSRWHCKRWFWSLCSIYWTRLISITDDAAKVMEVIARLPDCDGQAADAISAHTQWKMEDAQKIFRKIPNQSVRMYGNVFQNVNERSHGNTLRILLFFLTRNYTERQFVDGTWLGKSTKLGMLLRSQKTKLILVGLRGWHQNGRKEKQNLAPMLKKLMTDVDIEEPTSFFLITFTWDAFNGNANQARKLLDNTTICLNPVFLLEQPRNNQDGTNLAQTLQRGPTTWKDILGKAWNGTANWQTKRRSNFTKFFIFVWTTTKSKRKNWKIKVNCQKFAPIMYLNACIWHKLVDLAFCRQSTNLHDLSQIGLKHVTDDWHD